MIIPTKRLNEDRCLLYIGAEVLLLLKEAKTVSRLWEEAKKAREGRSEDSRLTYDWFVLSLDMLYTLGAIELNQGRVSRRLKA